MAVDFAEVEPLISPSTTPRLTSSYFDRFSLSSMILNGFSSIWKVSQEKIRSVYFGCRFSSDARMKRNRAARRTTNGDNG